MNLLIDMGNTRLKWAIESNVDIVLGEPIDNAKINRSALIQLWRDIASPNQLAISCVSTSQLFDLVVVTVNELWPRIPVVRVLSKTQGFGVINAYQEPEKLGVDRWLSLIAGYDRYRKALCIVGCGTAITLDRVDASGRHLGGLISPGLRLMKEALALNTENLGLNEIPYPFGLATFTDAAIYNGVLSAACGFIEHALKSQPDAPQLLLTGGDAETISAHLSMPAIIDPDLVFRGLSLTLRKQS
jgi:type III pantothenate kinase